MVPHKDISALVVFSTQMVFQIEPHPNVEMAVLGVLLGCLSPVPLTLGSRQRVNTREPGRVCWHALGQIGTLLAQFVALGPRNSGQMPVSFLLLQSKFRQVASKMWFDSDMHTHTHTHIPETSCGFWIRTCPV